MTFPDILNGEGTRMPAVVPECEPVNTQITQSLRGPDFLLLHRLLCSYFTRSLCGMAAPDLERVMVKSGAKVIKQHGISFSLFHLLDED